MADWVMNFGNLFYLLELTTKSTNSDINECVNILNQKHKLTYCLDLSNYPKIKNCQRNLGESFDFLYREHEKLVPILCDKLFRNDRVKTSFMHVLFVFCCNIESFDKECLEELKSSRENNNFNDFLSRLFEVANKVSNKNNSLLKDNIKVEDILDREQLFNVKECNLNNRIINFSTPIHEFDFRAIHGHIDRKDKHGVLLRDILKNMVYSDKNITFVHGLAGSGKTSIARKFFDDDGTFFAWFSAKFRKNDLTLEYIFNKLLEYYKCYGFDTLCMHKKEEELDKLLPPNFKIVLDDLEKSPELFNILEWVFRCNQKHPSCKFVLTCQLTPDREIKNFYQECTEYARENIINFFHVSGMNKEETQELVNKKIITTTKFLNTIVEDNNNCLIEISDSIFRKTDGNPQAVVLSVAYIDNRIHCGTSLKTLLQTDDVLGEVERMFTCMWNSLDKDTKKVIATVGLTTRGINASKISDVTKLSGMEQNGNIPNNTPLGKAIYDALCSSMTEFKMFNGEMLFTKHGLVYIFFQKTLLNNSCPIVKKIYYHLQLSDELEQCVIVSENEKPS